MNLRHLQEDISFRTHKGNPFFSSLVKMCREVRDLWSHMGLKHKVFISHASGSLAMGRTELMQMTCTPSEWIQCFCHDQQSSTLAESFIMSKKLIQLHIIPPQSIKTLQHFQSELPKQNSHKESKVYDFMFSNVFRMFFYFKKNKVFSLKHNFICHPSAFRVNCDTLHRITAE